MVSEACPTNPREASGDPEAVHAGGSITGQTYVPRFSVDYADGRVTITAVLDTLGVGARTVDRPGDAHGDEVEPATDASICGRFLVACGAPRGAKVTVTTLPSWLGTIPDAIRLAAARAYVRIRATVHDWSPRRVKLQEDRPAAYLDTLFAFVRSFDPDATHTESGTILLSGDGTDRLYQYPDVA